MKPIERRPAYGSRTGRFGALDAHSAFRAVQTCIWLLLGNFAGCSPQATMPSTSAYEVEFRAESDAGSAVDGVSVFTGRRLLGTTDQEGRLHFRLQGTEGQTMPVNLKCPDGYKEPEHPSTIRLARTKSVDVQADQPLKLGAICMRLSRDIAVVVFADQGSAVPVTIDGEPATVTSSDGFAQVLLHVAREVHSVTVGLDTNTYVDLVPKNPRRTYELPAGDAILVFNQKFARQKLGAAHSNVHKESRHVPYRID